MKGRRLVQPFKSTRTRHSVKLPCNGLSLTGHRKPGTTLSATHLDLHLQQNSGLLCPKSNALLVWRQLNKWGWLGVSMKE